MVTATKWARTFPGASSAHVPRTPGAGQLQVSCEFSGNPGPGLDAFNTLVNPKPCKLHGPQTKLPTASRGWALDAHSCRLGVDVGSRPQRVLWLRFSGHSLRSHAQVDLGTVPSLCGTQAVSPVTWADTSKTEVPNAPQLHCRFGIDGDWETGDKPQRDGSPAHVGKCPCPPGVSVHGVASEPRPGSGPPR